ncbi:uncharacterized protein LOC112493959 [Cephus cinctus]|uniref:Uncharacterized protein LOC112493959 n=1 Tax=Cephus cinctus TaxID=211228 RepID=A0AAJ7RBV3_CEPCN|nr:uncharacterized protein LOC112493959 [Cephus cinctus]
MKVEEKMGERNLRRVILLPIRCVFTYALRRATGANSFFGPRVKQVFGMKGWRRLAGFRGSRRLHWEFKALRGNIAVTPTANHDTSLQGNQRNFERHRLRGTHSSSTTYSNSKTRRPMSPMEDRRGSQVLCWIKPLPPAGSLALISFQRDCCRVQERHTMSCREAGWRVPCHPRSLKLL